MNNAGSGAVSSMSIDDIGFDNLESIFSRLPAKCFASAACVNRIWSSVCTAILSSPKLTSSMSLNPIDDVAVNEVIEKVLSEPIRPQFSVAYVLSPDSPDLPHINSMITTLLGSRVPVVTLQCWGIIRRDAHTNEFKKVPRKDYVGENSDDRLTNYGLLLTLGYLPGLKVGMIPLKSEGEVANEHVDEFVTNIRE